MRKWLQRLLARRTLKLPPPPAGDMERREIAARLVC